MFHVSVNKKEFLVFYLCLFLELSLVFIYPTLSKATFDFKKMFFGVFLEQIQES